MSRKERRAAEHAARKAARKAGFPTTTPKATAAPTLEVPVDPTITANENPVAPASASESSVVPEPINKHRKPPTPGRLTANRANAQLSHAATTEAGKSISAQNRTIHGLTVTTASSASSPLKIPMASKR